MLLSEMKELMELPISIIKVILAPEHTDLVQ